MYEPIAPFRVHTYGELYKQMQGLTQEAAEEMLDQVGPNVIPFKVDPFVKMLVDEFFNFFYLYQWIMYTVWFWFSYLFVAAMLVSIVFAAAALNIYTNYRNQAAIAKVRGALGVVALVCGRSCCASACRSTFSTGGCWLCGWIFSISWHGADCRSTLLCWN